MHINQSRSRSNEIARYQEVAQTAISEGRLSVEDFGEEFRTSALNGFIDFEELFTRHGSSRQSFLSALKIGFIDIIERSQQSVLVTVSGQDHAYDALTFTSSDFFTMAPAHHYGESCASLRSNTLTKNAFIGLFASKLDQELGSRSVSPGIQLVLFMLHSYSVQTVPLHSLTSPICKSVNVGTVLRSAHFMISLAANEIELSS
jgi:hypothetical protein